LSHPTPEVEVCQVRRFHAEDIARARALLVDAPTYEGLADLFGALADPTRARIVHTLLRQELCTCDLAAVHGITESAVSQHLRVLRMLRLVKHRRAGKLVYYSLDDAHVAQLVQIGLAHEGHSGEILDLGVPAPASERQAS
jgi:DNA-binding transcriptional ArsR family regulator